MENDRCWLFLNAWYVKYLTAEAERTSVNIAEVSALKFVDG